MLRIIIKKERLESNKMEEKYSNALKEVYIILENSENSIKEKIPKKLKEFIVKNMNQEYKPQIDFNNKNWKNSIMKETKQFLAVLYRDYIIDKTKRKLLLQEELEQEERVQNQLKEKYNAENIFPKNNIEDNLGNSKNISQQQTIEMVPSKNNIFTRLIRKLKQVVKK